MNAGDALTMDIDADDAVRSSGAAAAGSRIRADHARGAQ